MAKAQPYEKKTIDLYYCLLYGAITTKNHNLIWRSLEIVDKEKKPDGSESCIHKTRNVCDVWVYFSRLPSVSTKLLTKSVFVLLLIWCNVFLR